MAAGAAPREFHPSGGLPEPCPLPATLLTLGLWLQGSIIVLFVRPRPQIATSALQPGCWSLAHKEVLAHRLYGSAQTECIRMPFTAPPLSCGAFFVKVRLRAPAIGESVERE